MNTSVSKRKPAAEQAHTAPPSKGKKITVPIDLPGQPIQCWTNDVETLTVILRKHRDVIFDIELVRGKQYTVSSESSSVYDTRSKKIVHPRENISFKDGEPLHLWVGRNFKGNLLLFDGGKQIGRYTVNQLDPTIENIDPAFKPAPIVIAMKNHSNLGGEKLFNVVQIDGTYTTPPPQSQHESEKFLHVVELSFLKGVTPTTVADYFKHGGEKEIFASGDVVTHNWVMNQVVALAAYVSDNKTWIKELWGEKLTLRTIDHPDGSRKMYAILTGSTRVRNLLSSAHYAAADARVLSFTFGAGSLAGVGRAGWEAAKGNLRGAGIYTIIFTITLDISEWIADYEQRDPKTGKPKADIADLFIKIGIDVVKNIMISAISSFLLGAFLSFIGIVAAPVGVIVIGTIVASLAVGYVVELLDKQYGVSAKAAAAIKNTPSLLERKFPLDYKGYRAAIDDALIYGFSE